MANLRTVLTTIRDADAAERARQLMLMKRVYVPPPVNPGQPVARMLNGIRDANPGRRKQLLEEMTEQYADDNPDDDKPRENRKDRGRRNLKKFLLDEKRAGRPRPSRQNIERKIRQEERTSQRQLDQDLVEDYDQLIQLGLVDPRA